jgi:WD40 repeat protein
LATASEKTINLWDLVSLQNITTLKGHKDEIRTLYVKGDTLFSAGKGGTSYGAMLVWDLRNLG